jgi:hypothetical protein
MAGYLKNMSSKAKFITGEKLFLKHPQFFFLEVKIIGRGYKKKVYRYIYFFFLVARWGFSLGSSCLFSRILVKPFINLLIHHFKMITGTSTKPTILIPGTVPSVFNNYRGLYIGKYPPPPSRGEISADVIWGKNMKSRREKGGKCKE